MDKRPVLKFTGQSTPEILAHIDSHSHLSLLYAFEWGYTSLRLWKRGWDPTVEEAADVVRRIAQVRAIPASEHDCEAAAILFCFNRAVRNGNVEHGTSLCQRAFELVRDESMHQIEHKAWVEALIAKSCFKEADKAALDYLSFLRSGGPEGQSELGRSNSVAFWARVVKENRVVLPLSTEFFKSSFPEVNLDEVKLRPKLNIKFPKSRKPITMLSNLPEFSSEGNQ